MNIQPNVLSEIATGRVDLSVDPQIPWQIRGSSDRSASGIPENCLQIVTWNLINHCEKSSCTEIHDAPKEEKPEKNVIIEPRAPSEPQIFQQEVSVTI